MTRFLLIRHAAVELPRNIIGGRSPGIHLTASGREEAERLADRLAHEEISAIYASQRQRARETAQYIADRQRLSIKVAPELDEIDYGEWTGCSIDELAQQARWQAFNWTRSCARIPGGELIVEVQARIAGFIDRLRGYHVKGSVVLISHSDVIRAALAYYLNLPIDLMLRLEINPASVSILNLTHQGPSVRCINHTEGLPQ